MKIVVIGAGVIGVTSAWFLAGDGHDVTVIDRQPGPALETSYANGGQISVSHAEPWANPAAIGRIIRWFGQEDAPLLWRLRADPAQWAWGLRFLAQCRQVRTLDNMRALVALGLYSRESLGNLRAELGLTYDQQLRGILHVYTDHQEFERACVQARWMRQFGCEREPATADECLVIEPALKNSIPLSGGTFTAGDESGDAHMFTSALAAHAQAIGVRFHYGCTVSKLCERGNRILAVEIRDGEHLAADAFVMAAGSFSVQLLRSVGIPLPVYPAKGYSATFLPTRGVALPTVSLTDDTRKLVFSRLGQRLRVAGTAEFSGYDTGINRLRCKAIVDRATQFFPSLANCEAVEFWAGLRPSTPGNVPIVGASSFQNLWLNTGHATLGWTLACGSARLLATLVSAKTPALNPAPYSLR
ncbi:MAG: D-amino acid dehydrogenase [Rhodocyclaceae bacterium]|nr:D-amino acid dehydrogenase [Rhodocyclaceae bacterium]